MSRQMSGRVPSLSTGRGPRGGGFTAGGEGEDSGEGQVEMGMREVRKREEKGDEGRSGERENGEGRGGMGKWEDRGGKGKERRAGKRGSGGGRGMGKGARTP